MTALRAVLLTLLLGGLMFVSLDTGALSDQHEIAGYYIRNGREETGAANIVTSIYLGYRAYDTFGEAMALFTAATGVFLLFQRRG